MARQDGHHLGSTIDEWLGRVSTLLSRLTLVLAVVGAALAAARRDGPVLRLVAAAVLLLLPALIALGDARYRMPAIPMLVVIALTTFRPRGSSPAPEATDEAAAPGWDELPERTPID